MNRPFHFIAVCALTITAVSCGSTPPETSSAEYRPTVGTCGYVASCAAQCNSTFQSMDACLGAIASEQAYASAPYSTWIAECNQRTAPWRACMDHPL